MEDDKLENQIQNQQKNNDPFSSKVVILAVALSLIFGSFAGAFGAYELLTNPNVQKFFPNLVNSQGTISQNITLNEESAVIDVVKQTGPAVVSIVVSKDLSKIPGYGSNPFLNDPFFDFFYNQAPSQSQEPNIQQVGAGSGFFVSADGLILTNKHVVSDESASYTVLTQDGNKYEAKISALDPINDLAILKVEIKNAPFLTLADSDQIQIGQRVVAIGNSLGQYQNTVTAGIVSGVGRRITAGGAGSVENLSGVIQTDAAINPGNSGGPLLNLSGQVIGINTAIDQQGQSVGFAIPAKDALKALASFQKNGKIVRPLVGVRYIAVTPEIAKEMHLQRDYGALLIKGNTANQSAVLPDSPAEKAGLKEGDIILEVNGAKVDEQHSLADLLKDFDVGDSLSLKVFSNGEEKTINLVLGQIK